MNSKQREISKMVPLLKGKEVEIWISVSEKEPFCWGVVKGFTGSYLLFESLHFWNGRIVQDETMHTNTIKKLTIRTAMNSAVNRQ
jgi:hypothetical protein